MAAYSSLRVKVSGRSLKIVLPTFKFFVSEEGSEGDWVISADMLEPRKADDKPEESDEDFSVRFFNLCS